jgi:hypothetical protein
MFTVVSRGLLSFCLAWICALPAWGASRSLPGNAVITVKPFSFPAAVPEATERNLPAVFHDQIVFTLQGAGFILSPADSAAPPPVRTAIPHSAAGARSPEKPPVAPPEERTVLPEEEAETGEGDAVILPSDQVALLPPAAERPEDTRDVEPLAEDAADAAGPVRDARTEAAQVSPASPSAPAYVLSGRVTQLREYASPPAGIAGGLRARYEAALSLTYSIADPSSGKTLFSDAVSASVTRLVPENEDADAARSDLTARAMAGAAAKLAARLAGTDAETSAEDRDYYGDSPGKRLKPGK